LVFDSFDAWSGPYGKVRVSGLREQIQQYLPDNYYSVHDSMQMVEHSVEALIPFLQNHRRDVEIVSILVPYMDMGRITDIAKVLSNAIFKVLNANNLRWGDDVALLVTSDAVHYGDEEWGGKDYAPFGTDSLGTARALTLENEIFRNCFGDTLQHENAERFYAYTVNPANFREYKWTWCGRYSVPMGLETSVFLQELLHLNPLVGMPLGYSTSILNAHLPVEDLRMGKTAVATQHHWVGYPAAGFK
jgi:AmmeMemoRadiSam system protein B